MNIDECASMPCQSNSNCIDLDNKFICKCINDFGTGILCDSELNQCELLSPCKNFGTCENFGNSYKCVCAAGFFGVNCEFDTNECKSHPCGLNGVCLDQINGFNCVCLPGWSGINCQTKLDLCGSFPCLNGGNCVQDSGVQESGQFSCTVRSKF